MIIEHGLGTSDIVVSASTVGGGLPVYVGYIALDRNTIVVSASTVGGGLPVYVGYIALDRNTIAVHIGPIISEKAPGYFSQPYEGPVRIHVSAIDPHGPGVLVFACDYDDI